VNLIRWRRNVQALRLVMPRTLRRARCLQLTGPTRWSG